MKQMKKLASVLLLIAVVLTMTVGTAFAASGTNGNTGKIEINNAVLGQTYTIYQILKLESYNTNPTAYAYKATDVWKPFVEGTDIKGVYLSTDDQGYVTWVQGASAADFAAKAIQFAATLEANQGSTKATSSTVTFSSLNLGYYLVDSELGVLCSLDTTDPEVVIKEKNGAPTIDKKVQEGNEWGESSDAKIGDTVNFKSTINVIDGNPKDYVMHDTMSEGLAFQADSVKVYVNNTEKTKDTDYILSNPATDGHSFDIKFNNLKPNDVIVVEYSAILNDKAVIYDAANTNKVKLSYTDTNSIAKETAEVETKTYTYMFDIIKTDSNLKVLPGAEFKLFDAQTAGNEIALIKVMDGVYRVATDAEKAVDGFQSAVIEAGKVTIKGLDGNTSYWLEETKAPAGYNILPARVEVKIEKTNLTTTMTGDTWAAGNGGVQITNNTGAELPSTGGIGTTIFYVLGAALVIGAGVLLVTRRRMNKNN